MRIGRLEQRQGRVLKLGDGMLVLAVVMLVRPALLEDVAGAGLTFGVAAALTAAVLITHATGGPRAAPEEPVPVHRGPARRPL